MAAYAYTALAADGASRTGVVQADDALSAGRTVEALGLVPTTVKPVELGMLGRRIPQAQVLAFARSLSGLLAAGVPLSRALTVIEREATQPAARAAWSRIHARVRDGSSLAEAMAQERGIFPPEFVAMVKAGEAGGFLDVVLEQMADYLERTRELTGRVSAALIYPALLALIAGGVVAFLLVWFIPRFETLFASFHRELPVVTQVVLGISRVAAHQGWIILLVLVVMILGGRWLLHQKAVADWAERLQFRLPGVGEVRATLARVRFCRMLGTLLKAGVPMLSALQVAREVVASPVLSAALSSASDQVRQGTALSLALAGASLMLPPTALEGLAVAEGSGRLAPELLRLADASEKDLDRRLRTLVALAEPLLLMLMAGVVGTIVIGMLMPIFDLWSAIA